MSWLLVCFFDVEGRGIADGVELLLPSSWIAAGWHFVDQYPDQPHGEMTKCASNAQHTKVSDGRGSWRERSCAFVNQLGTRTDGSKSASKAEDCLTWLRGSKWRWCRHGKIAKSSSCFVILANSSCDDATVVKDQLKTCGVVWWGSIFALSYKPLFLY